MQQAGGANPASGGHWDSPGTGPEHPCPVWAEKGQPSGGLNLPSPSKLVSSASVEFGTWTWRSWFLSLTLPRLWWDRNQLLHIQAPDCLANMRGSCLNPHETLHAVLPLGKHLELTPPWQGLLEGVTGTAGTWEQLRAGDLLVGDRLRDRRAERRSKLGRLKRWRLEGGESRGEEMHPALRRGMLAAPLGPSDAAGAIPTQGLLGKQPYLLARHGPGPRLPTRLGSENRREQPEQQASSFSHPMFKQEHVGLWALPAPSRSSSALWQAGQEPGSI